MDRRVIHRIGLIAGLIAMPLGRNVVELIVRGMTFKPVPDVLIAEGDVLITMAEPANLRNLESMRSGGVLK
jgi:uncharacterized protein with PhoU and TrkA domain